MTQHNHFSLALTLLLLAGAVKAATPEAPVDSLDAYDPDNIFAHILRGELPAKVVYESDFALSFHDIRPQARAHVLVIPKGPYTNINHFNSKATSAEKLGFLDAISHTAEIMGVSESGFRLVNNTGLDGGQSVGHMHFHLLGGEYVRPLQEQA